MCNCYNYFPFTQVSSRLSDRCVYFSFVSEHFSHPKDLASSSPAGMFLRFLTAFFSFFFSGM